MSEQAQNTYDVVFLGGLYCQLDGFFSVRLNYYFLFFILLKTRHDSFDNIFSFFSAWIVACNEYKISKLFSDAGHAGTLGSVPVSAAAENYSQFAFA